MTSTSSYQNKRVESWPELHLRDWRETCDTLHMLTQIVGKIRMALTPPVNHFWHSALYISPLGLTTSIIPHDSLPFEMEFDFVNHDLWIRTSDGSVKGLPLFSRAVADFYGELMGTLKSVGIDARIWTQPQEFADAIPFEQDRTHAAYDPEYAARFHRVLLSMLPVLLRFRSRFVGKCSPVNFFWGSFDVALTRFSGRRAPERAGADTVTREAYSHECYSCGWWPGGGPVDDAAFYAYMAPEPSGFKDAQVGPAEATYDDNLDEFILPYEEVRKASAPEEALLRFLETTYEAGANLANWNRAELEGTGAPPAGRTSGLGKAA